MVSVLPKHIFVLISRTCDCDLIWKRVFADIIKLRILKQDHSGLSEWALNPMTSILRHPEEKRVERARWLCEDSNRGWNEEQNLKNAGSHPKLEEARTRISSIASERTEPTL